MFCILKLPFSFHGFLPESMIAFLPQGRCAFTDTVLAQQNTHISPFFVYEKRLVSTLYLLKSAHISTHTGNTDQNTYIKGMNKHPTAISNKLISSHQKMSEYIKTITLLLFLYSFLQVLNTFVNRFRMIRQIHAAKPIKILTIMILC